MKLGNILEKTIAILTLGQGKNIALYIAKLRGKEDCGCNRRKEKLNNMLTKNKSTSLSLDWSSKWGEIREQVSCSCQFDYTILTVYDSNNNLIHEEKLSATPYMNGQIQSKDILIPDFFIPSSFSLLFHKKKEGEFINPIKIKL